MGGLGGENGTLGQSRTFRPLCKGSAMLGSIRRLRLHLAQQSTLANGRGKNLVLQQLQQTAWRLACQEGSHKNDFSCSTMRTGRRA